MRKQAKGNRSAWLAQTVLVFYRDKCNLRLVYQEITYVMGQNFLQIPAKIGFQVYIVLDTAEVQCLSVGRNVLAKQIPVHVA